MAVTFDARGLPFVKSLEGAHHQNHRHTGKFRIRLKALADLITVSPRHKDVGQNKIRLDPLGTFNRLGAVGGRFYDDILIREGESHDFVYGDAVVCDKQFLGHWGF